MNDCVPSFPSSVVSLRSLLFCSSFTRFTFDCVGVAESKEPSHMLTHKHSDDSPWHDSPPSPSVLHSLFVFSFLFSCPALVNES